MSRVKIWVTRSLIVSVAPTVTFFSRLVRNIILSRLLIPDQFGTAIAISLVVGLAGLITDVGLDRFILIDESKCAMGAAHAVLAVRGALIALALVAGAPLIASVFGIPQYAGSFALAGIVPFISGFAHLGIIQVQKKFYYGRETVGRLVANLAAVGGVFLGALVLRDHRAIIAGFVAESLAYVILSQLLSRGPFHLRTDRATLLAALSFGLPLTINGVALATISQLDRVIVGHWFGVIVLGTYAVILNVAVVPVSFMLVVFQKLGFSYLLSDDSEPQFAVNADNYQLLTFVYSMLAIAYALWVLLTLDILTPAVFGPAFKVAPTVSAAIACMVFLRLQRGGAPTIALLTMGRTSELALWNFTAVFGLLIALALVRLWPRFESILAGVVFGDFLVLVLFRFASSTARSLNNATAATEFLISLVSLAIMVGTFLWTPAPGLEARCTVMLAGLLGIGMQFACGVGQQGIRSRLVHGGAVNHGPSG